jgi:hypothetical protein
MREKNHERIAFGRLDFGRAGEVSADFGERGVESLVDQLEA